MTHPTLATQVLIALFELCRNDAHVSARTLADAVSITPTRAAACLIELERAGLCDASRARLTMLGLATAAQLVAGAAGGGARRTLRRISVRRTVAHAALPIAALPSLPPVAPLS